MRFPIDISVFTSDQAIGMVSGHLDLANLPRIGESLAFSFGKSGVSIPKIKDFAWVIRVENIIHPVDGSQTMIMLEDLYLSSASDARELMAHLESAYGLIADYWEDSPSSSTR